MKEVGFYMKNASLDFIPLSEFVQKNQKESIGC